MVQNVRDGASQIPSVLQVRVKNTLVWVNYPPSVRRETIEAFVVAYYQDHPGKFRPFESIEFTLADIWQYFVHLQPTIPDIRQRAPRQFKREAYNTLEPCHGEPKMYRRGCRCSKCVEAWRIYQKGHRERCHS